MEIVIHTRNAALAEDFHDIAHEKISAMQRFNVDIQKVEIEVIHEQNPRQGKHSHKVIIATHGAGPMIRSEATEFNDVAAFDVAIKSFELQVRKIHEKNKDYNRETIRNKRAN